LSLMQIVLCFLALTAAVMGGFAFLNPVGSSSGVRVKRNVSFKSGGSDNTDSNEVEMLKRVKPTKRDYVRAYDSGASFTDLLPYLEYLPKSQQLLLTDGVTRVAMYELEPVPTEGRSKEVLEKAVEDIERMVSDSFPEHVTNPWVFQIYVSGEGDLSQFMEHVKDYINPEILKTKYTQGFIERNEQHLSDISRDDGYFEDDLVTRSMWRGRMVKIRVVFFRKYYDGRRGSENAELELEEVCSRFESNIIAGDIRYRRMTGEDFYYWLLFWFNPRPDIAGGRISDLRKCCPYPGDDELPLGTDLSVLLCRKPPTADAKKGYMYFDDLPHAAIQVVSLTRKPRAGQMTGESDYDGSSMFDRLPEGTVISYNLIVAAQDQITNRITVVRDRAVGDTAESRNKRADAEDVLDRQNRGDPIYPLEMCIYVRGEDDADLKIKLNKIRTLLSQNSLLSVEPSEEAIPFDNYFKNLPAVYNASLDMDSREKANPYFGSDAAKLSPIFGRSRGTGNPGLFFFNRTGEPFVVDPLNYKDRTRSAHMMLFGPTGAGKSATSLHMLDTLIAVHRPRVFVTDFGNSFGLFEKHCKKHGLTTHKTILSIDNDVSIPPFIHAMQLLDLDEDVSVDALIDVVDDPDLIVANNGVDEEYDELGIDVKRDYIGEMELTAQIMIQAAEPEKKLTGGQRLAIRIALKNAAQTVFDRFGKDGIVIPEDVADELTKLSKDDDYAYQGALVAEIAQSLKLFCSGLNGHLFNRREGHLWPEVDLNVIDLAQSAGEGNQATMDVAMVSLLQSVSNIAEREQYSGRHTVFFVDEAHLLMVGELLPVVLVKATKTWRKWSSWLFLSTQNVDDISATGKKMLSMIEWWILLAMSVEEVEKLSEFRELTEEQKHMIRQAVKNPGKYVEGVVLSTRTQSLIRNVPPSHSLALALTEGHEKKDRMDLIKDHGLKGEYAEYDAACMVAENIRNKRLGIEVDSV